MYTEGLDGQKAYIVLSGCVNLSEGQLRFNRLAYGVVMKRMQTQNMSLSGGKLSNINDAFKTKKTAPLSQNAPPLTIIEPARDCQPGQMFGTEVLHDDCTLGKYLQTAIALEDSYLIVMGEESYDVLVRERLRKQKEEHLNFIQT